MNSRTGATCPRGEVWPTSSGIKCQMSRLPGAASPTLAWRLKLKYEKDPQIDQCRRNVDYDATRGGFLRGRQEEKSAPTSSGIKCQTSMICRFTQPVLHRLQEENFLHDFTLFVMIYIRLCLLAPKASEASWGLSIFSSGSKWLCMCEWLLLCVRKR